MTELRRVSEGEIGGGSTLSYKWRGREVEADITGYEPERLFAIHSSEKSYEFNEAVSLQSNGDDDLDVFLGESFVASVPPPR